jgi:hypothetical protein
VRKDAKRGESLLLRALEVNPRYHPVLALLGDHEGAIAALRSYLRGRTYEYWWMLARDPAAASERCAPLSARDILSDRAELNVNGWAGFGNGGL